MILNKFSLVIGVILTTLVMANLSHANQTTEAEVLSWVPEIQKAIEEVVGVQFKRTPEIVIGSLSSQKTLKEEVRPAAQLIAISKGQKPTPATVNLETVGILTSLLGIRSLLDGKIYMNVALLKETLTSDVRIYSPGQEAFVESILKDSVQRESFLKILVAHEMTHALQFQEFPKIAETMRKVRKSLDRKIEAQLSGKEVPKQSTHERLSAPLKTDEEISKMSVEELREYGEQLKKLSQEFEQEEEDRKSFDKLDETLKVIQTIMEGQANYVALEVAKKLGLSEIAQKYALLYEQGMVVPSDLENSAIDTFSAQDVKLRMALEETHFKYIESEKYIRYLATQRGVAAAWNVWHEMPNSTEDIFALKISANGVATEDPFYAAITTFPMQPLLPVGWMSLAKDAKRVPRLEIRNNIAGIYGPEKANKIISQIESVFGTAALLRTPMPDFPMADEKTESSEPRIVLSLFRIKDGVPIEKVEALKVLATPPGITVKRDEEVLSELIQNGAALAKLAIVESSVHLGYGHDNKRALTIIGVFAKNNFAANLIFIVGPIDESRFNSPKIQKHIETFKKEMKEAISRLSRGLFDHCNDVLTLKQLPAPGGNDGQP